MVQVDVLFAYAIGATYAAAASRQLKNEETPFFNKYFIFVLLFFSCIFVPYGVYLVWEIPHWETMQVAQNRSDIPGWLVVLFCITNVTQGILGYLIGYKFIQKGKLYFAHLNWFLAYVFMLLILMYGWDGLGWQRFWYDKTINNGVPWSPGMYDGLNFLYGNVAITLYKMGIVVLPMLILPVAIWIKRGAETDPALPTEKVPNGIFRLMAVHVMGTVLGAVILAALASIMIYYVGLITGHIASYFVGLPLFCVVIYFLFLRKQMPVYVYLKQLFLYES